MAGTVRELLNDYINWFMERPKIRELIPIACPERAHTSSIF